MKTIRVLALHAWSGAIRYRFSLWIVVFTLAVTYALGVGHRNDVRYEALIEAQQVEVETEAAETCVGAWTRAEETRDSVERGVRGGAAVSARALIAVAGDRVGPETVERYLAYIDEQADAEVAAARDEITDPDCDLEAAKELLG